MAVREIKDSASEERPPDRLRNGTRLVLENAALLAGYVFFGVLALKVVAPSGYEAHLWPPAGIAIAAVILFGLRMLPGIGIGAFILNLVAMWPDIAVAQFLAAIGGALGAVFQASVGLWIVRRFIRSPVPFSNARDTAFSFIHIPVIGILGALIAVTSLVLLGLRSWQEAVGIIPTWWFGDTMGIFVFAPIVVFLFQRSVGKFITFSTVVLIGIGGSLLASESIRTEAQSRWSREAQQDVDRLTSSFLYWLDLSYAPLQSFAALYTGSNDVSEEEFIEAARIIEENHFDFFPDSIAFLRQDANKKWKIEQSVDSLGRFVRGQYIKNDGARQIAVDAALANPGALVLGSMLKSDSGETMAVAGLTVGPPNSQNVLLATVSFSKLAQGLLKLQAPRGITLRISGRLAGANYAESVRQIYGRSFAPPDAVNTVELRGISAKAQLTFAWDVSNKYLGGPSVQLANVVLVGGMFGTIIAAVFIGFLLAQNENVRRAVQRRTAEVAEKSDLLKAILESLAQGVVAFDRDLKLVIWNDRLVDVRGYPTELLEEGQPFERFMRYDVERNEFGEGDPEEIFERKVREAHNFVQHEFERQRPDGQFIEVRGGPIPGGGFVSTYADITERKSAQDALETERARFYSLLQAAPDATIIVDASGSIVFANLQCERIFGYESDELVGQMVEELVPPDVRSAHPKLREGFARTSTAREMGVGLDLRALRKDGTEFLVEISLSPLETDEGAFVAASIRDVTERRATELELKERLDELADARRATLNMMADAEANRKRAEELRDEAESATMAKSNFLAAMSHEIRTPMNGVVGMIDLLRQTKLDEDQQEMVGVVRDSAFSLLQIINDILDFSKIEAGKLEFERIPISLRDAVDGVAEALAPNTAKKELLLFSYIDPRIPEWVLGDQVRLRQVLFNFGGNAVKFTENTEEKRGRISLRADLLDDSDPKSLKVKFTVRDSGIGIPEDVLPTLFQPFTQAESSTTRRFGGTGLGLSICSRLAELMNGEVEVTSTVGEGSDFSVTIPFEATEADASAMEDSDLSGLTILLTTEIEEFQEIIPSYLSHWKAQVTVAPSIELAIGKIKNGEAFDIAIFGPEVDREIVSSLDSGISTKFVHLQDAWRRSARIETSDTVTVDANPLRRSSFVTSIAVAAGRASPEVKKDADIERMGPGTAPTPEEALAQGRLILVAEDNVTNQNVIRRQLNLLGYACDVVENGNEALDALKERNYAILLTDCHMPEMDGYDLTSTIREDEGPGDDRFPIIAITANALQGEAERCLEVGMDDYLSKPLEMNRLKQTLAKWMPITATAGSAVQTPVTSRGTEVEAEFAEIGDETDVSDETIRIEEAEVEEVEIAEVEIAEVETAEPDETESTAETLGDIENAVDVSALTNVFGDDQEVVREILQEFIEPSEEIVGEIVSAFGDRDAAKIGSESHKLKSAARSVGANRLADLCADLEKAGKAADWDELDKLSPGIVGELGAVTAFIGKY